MIGKHIEQRIKRLRHCTCMTCQREALFLEKKWAKNPVKEPWYVSVKKYLRKKFLDR